MAVFETKKLIQALRSMGGPRRSQGIKPVGKPRMSGRDVISLLLSLAAFGISVSTFYLNTFRKVDDLRVIISEPPYFTAEFQKTAGAIEVSRTATVVFVNSGNRYASIVEMGVVVLQKTNDEKLPDDYCGEHDNETKLYYTRTPTTIKPSETTVVNLSFDHNPKRMEYQDPSDNGEWVRAFMHELSTVYKIRGCMFFSIATPSRTFGYRTVYLPIADGEYHRGERDIDTPFAEGESRILIHVTGSLLSSD